MAISLRLQPCKPNLPLMDSSNRTPTKRHAHLRSLSASTLRKSPPTCTLSLASVTTGPAIAISLSSFPSTPSEASCGIPFPSEADVATSESSAVTPDPWRRPRARTSHVVTQRRAQQPSKPRRVSCRSLRNTAVCGTPTPALHLDTSSASPPSPQLKTPTPSELRLAALVERSIAHHIATRSSPSSSSSSSTTIEQLDKQDALLLTHLRAFLTSHGKPPSPSAPSPSPIGIAIGIAIAPPTCAPSLLLCGSSGITLPPAPASSPPHPPAPATSPLRFIPGTNTTTALRARSGSRGTTITLTMPALVATLIFRRHEPGRACSPSSFVSRREAGRAMPRRSGLGGRCILAEDDDSTGR